MRINHNISALNTYRQFNTNTVATSKSMEKLSSGLRINRAADDAACQSMLELVERLAIAEQRQTARSYALIAAREAA